MARRGGIERGLLMRRNAAGEPKWFVRLYHEGRDRRFGSFSEKELAQEFYLKAKALQAQGCFYPEEYQKTKKNRLVANVKISEQDNSGVYVLQAIASGKFKIGFSRNTKKRIGILQRMGPERLYLLGCLRNATRGDETTFHKELRDHRQYGEWFILNKATRRWLIQKGIKPL